MIFHIESICLWKLLTGHECIGCGITRAIVCLLKLDFKGAINYNPFAFIAFPILLFEWLKYIYKTMQRTRLRSIEEE